MSPAYQVLGAMLGYLIAQLVRYVTRTRFWSNVAKQAQQYIEDPDVPVTDPNEAAERALVEAQRPSVERVARRVRKTMRPESSDGRPPVE